MCTACGTTRKWFRTEQQVSKRQAREATKLYVTIVTRQANPNDLLESHPSTTRLPSQFHAADHPLSEFPAADKKRRS